MLHVSKHCSQHGRRNCRNYIGKVSYKTVNRARMLNTLPISKPHSKKTSGVIFGDLGAQCHSKIILSKLKCFSFYRTTLQCVICCPTL